MNHKSTTQELSRKKLQALAMRLNAANAETLRGDLIAAMIRKSIRKIIAISAGAAGVTGAIVMFDGQPFYAADRGEALFTMLQ